MQIKSLKKKSPPFDHTILGLFPRVIKIKHMHIRSALRLLVEALFKAERTKAQQYSIDDRLRYIHTMKYNATINTLYQNIY